MAGVTGYTSPGHVASQYKVLLNKPHTDLHDAIADMLDLIAAHVPTVIDDLTDVDVASKPTGDQIVLTWNPVTSKFEAHVNLFTNAQGASIVSNAAAAAAATAAANAATTAAATATSTATTAQNTANGHANAIAQLQGQVGALLSQVVID